MRKALAISFAAVLAASGYSVQAQEDAVLDRVDVPTVNADVEAVDGVRLIGGDLVADPELERAMNPLLRGAFCQSCRLWPASADGYYYIPYVMADVLPAVVTGLMDAAIDWFDYFTNIRFVPRNEEADYINVIQGSGCWSYLGTIRGKQDLSIGANCHTREVVIHELMHAIGMVHEHQRPERDDYITVNEENICSGSESQLSKIGGIRGGATAYDYASTMHYFPTAFGCTGPSGSNVVIQTNDSAHQATINAWRDLPSHCDLVAIDNLYPGPTRSPSKPCAAHELPRVCKPTDVCLTVNGQGWCNWACGTYCDNFAAPKSDNPSCEYKPFSEIDDYYYRATTTTPAPTTTPTPAPTTTPTPAPTTTPTPAPTASSVPDLSA